MTPGFFKVVVMKMFSEIPYASINKLAKCRSVILTKMSKNKTRKEKIPKTLLEGTNNFFINFSAPLE